MHHCVHHISVFKWLVCNDGASFNLKPCLVDRMFWIQYLIILHAADWFVNLESTQYD